MPSAENPFAPPGASAAVQGAPPAGPPPRYGQPRAQQYGQPPHGFPVHGSYGPPYGAPTPGSSPYGTLPGSGHTNGMAIASMVLGILWLYWVGSILALVFGCLAKQQIEQRGDSGGGMATAGIVLGWIGIGTLVLVFLLGAASVMFAPEPY